MTWKGPPVPPAQALLSLASYVVGGLTLLGLVVSDPALAGEAGLWAFAIAGYGAMMGLSRYAGPIGTRIGFWVAAAFFAAALLTIIVGTGPMI